MDKAASRIRLQLNAQGNLWLEIREFRACSDILLIPNML